MPAVEYITTKYTQRGIIRGGELLLTHADALDFIRDCEILGLVISGMDFFLVDERGRLPLSSTKLIASF